MFHKSNSGGFHPGGRLVNAPSRRKSKFACDGRRLVESLHNDRDISPALAMFARLAERVALLFFPILKAMRWVIGFTLPWIGTTCPAGQFTYTPAMFPFPSTATGIACGAFIVL